MKSKVPGWIWHYKRQATKGASWKKPISFVPHSRFPTLNWNKVNRKQTSGDTIGIKLLWWVCGTWPACPTTYCTKTVFLAFIRGKSGNLLLRVAYDFLLISRAIFQRYSKTLTERIGTVKDGHWKLILSEKPWSLNLFFYYSKCMWVHTELTRTTSKT